jgi:hypothetical protein
MISAHFGNRHRPAAVTAFCLALLLGAAPAALAVPILPEGDDPASGAPSTGTIPARVVEPSGGPDWTDLVLVGAIAFALAIAAIALVAAVRNPSPDPTPHA